MKQCPQCSQRLARADYEGLQVLQCPGCHGHLVDLLRLKAIKNRAHRSPDDLHAEIEAAFKGSTPDRITCPRCRRAMEKRPMSTRVPQVQCDLCRRCGLVWLDAGELAIAQRLHEASPAFRDYQDALARMRSLVDSPERIAAFERNFAQLPDEPEAFDEVLSGLGSALLDCLLLGRRPR